MTTRSVNLLDPARAVVATARVVERDGLFGGSIDLRATPAAVRTLFDEFEEVVNGQMFVFLDDVQAKIAALRLRAAFEDGSDAPVEDLQVFPGAGEVSFRTAAGSPPPGRAVSAGVAVPSTSVEIARERN